MTEPLRAPKNNPIQAGVGMYISSRKSKKTKSGEEIAGDSETGDVEGPLPRNPLLKIIEDACVQNTALGIRVLQIENANRPKPLTQEQVTILSRQGFKERRTNSRRQCKSIRVIAIFSTTLNGKWSHYTICVWRRKSIGNLTLGTLFVRTSWPSGGKCHCGATSWGTNNLRGEKHAMRRIARNAQKKRGQMDLQPKPGLLPKDLQLRPDQKHRNQLLVQSVEYH